MGAFDKAGDVDTICILLGGCWSDCRKAVSFGYTLYSPATSNPFDCSKYMHCGHPFDVLLDYIAEYIASVLHQSWWYMYHHTLKLIYTDLAICLYIFIIFIYLYFMLYVLRRIKLN